MQMLCGNLLRISFDNSVNSELRYPNLIDYCNDDRSFQRFPKLDPDDQQNENLAGQAQKATRRATARPEDRGWLGSTQQISSRRVAPTCSE
jgi:hypothetical protein